MKKTLFLAIVLVSLVLVNTGCKNNSKPEPYRANFILPNSIVKNTPVKIVFELIAPSDMEADFEIILPNNVVLVSGNLTGNYTMPQGSLIHQDFFVNFLEDGDYSFRVNLTTAYLDGKYIRESQYEKKISISYSGEKKIKRDPQLTVVTK